ncbi:lipopolysaccharide biosynthesis protein [Methylococcus sp. ANG]|uniref:lipopolysaccharide biosynthesis protein n=1 Tax=Methylococcus sp. ANG TaxID=3231903 RepID=UPI00345A9BB2
MSQNLRQKVIRALQANVFGQCVNIIIQLLSVPLFLKFWGAERYGEWLILSAIPSYLALSDLGFTTVAANEMTMSNARGDRAQTLATYQSTWVLLTLVSVAIMVAFPLLVYSVPLGHWLGVHTLARDDMLLAVILLGAGVCVTLQSGLVSALFRCEERYGKGIAYFNLLRLLEFGGTAVALLHDGGVVMVAAMILAIRISGVAMIYAIAHSFASWAKPGFRHASSRTIKTMVGPALAFLAFPLSNALNQQGFLMVIGAQLGPTAVVTFSTLRTIVRVVMQAANVINSSIWPEVSSAFARNDLRTFRELHRRACQASLWIALMCLGALAGIGPWLLRVWTSGAVAMQYECYLILLLGMAVGVFWLSSSMLQLAINQHKKMALVFVLASVMGVLLSTRLTSTLGLTGAAVAALGFEVAVALFVLPRSLALSRDNARNFWHAMVVWPSYVWSTKNE